MPMLSFAQNREDVLLNRVLPGPVGFYVDVGAADPVDLSVTKWFYDRGWSGINVEPQPKYYQALVAARPRDVNLNVLLSDAAGDVTFYELPERLGWATTDPAAAERLRGEGEKVVPRVSRAITLAEVCERYVRGPIDFLKIDVEEAEGKVLAGADFARWRPRVMVVEATRINSREGNHEEWEPLVLAADYLYATFDGLNRYYVRSEDRDLAPLLQVPPNVFDDYLPVEFIRGRDWWDRERATIHAEVARTEEAHRSKLEAARREVEATRREVDAAVAAVRQESDAALEAVRRELAAVTRAYEAATEMLQATRAHLDAVRGQVLAELG